MQRKENPHTLLVGGQIGVWKTVWKLLKKLRIILI